jgi:hypothetical protein
MVNGLEALVGIYSLGTASKVVNTLQEELVVSKDNRGIILQDVRRLLLLLRQSQRRLRRPAAIGKTSLTTEQIWNCLADLRRTDHKYRAVATGLASSGYHKVISGIDRLSLYVDNLEAARKALNVGEGRAFANIELIEDRKNVAYSNMVGAIGNGSARARSGFPTRKSLARRP